MTTNSSDQLFESLSAMVDNEASELEVHRILRNLEQNSEVQERWRRYHLIGSVMRKEYNVHATDAGKFISSVANGIDEGDAKAARGFTVGTATAGTSKKGVRDLLGKSAIAASFAATLVLGFHFTADPDQQGFGSSHLAVNAETVRNAPTESAVAPVVSHVPVGFEIPLPEARTVSMTSGGVVTPAAEFRSQSQLYVDDISDFATQELLNQLLIEHAERATAHGSLGIMPFARVHKMLPEHSAR